MMLCLIASVAFAVSPDVVEQRLQEIEELRAQRVERGAPPISMANARKAAQGSVVTGVTGSKAWAVAVLNIPIGQLWAGINDETRHPGYTAVAYSELISGRVCGSGRHVLQYLPVPMISDRWWIAVIRHNRTIIDASGGSVRELYWRSSVDPVEVTSAAGQKMIDAGAPIGSTRGAWLLVAVDQFNTYVEYYSNTDPGAGVPSSITSRLAASGVRDTIKAVHKFSAGGKPVCPVY